MPAGCPASARVETPAAGDAAGLLALALALTLTLTLAKP